MLNLRLYIALRIQISLSIVSYFVVLKTVRHFINCENLNIDFLSCRNNFFVKDVENTECCSSFWFQNENLFLSQSNGLPNLDINDSNPSNQIISSDFLNQVRCRNVII